MTTEDSAYPLPDIDCIKECPDLGACCRRMVVWANGKPWPVTEDPIEAQKEIDNYRGGALPFELLAHGETTDPSTHEPGGRHAWYLRCKMVTTNGLCSMYDNRPDLCRIFAPGSDPLCVKHPDHPEALVRFDKGMGELIIQGNHA